jgi:hypothetical protein
LISESQFGGRYLVITATQARHVKTLRAAREQAQAVGAELWVE